MNTLEVKAICLVCGHTPLADLALPVVNEFNLRFADTQSFAGDETDHAPEAPGDIGAETGEPWYPAPMKASGRIDDTGKREWWYRKHAGLNHAGKACSSHSLSAWRRLGVLLSWFCRHDGLKETYRARNSPAVIMLRSPESEL